MVAQLSKHLFTVGQYYRMAETGILTPDDRVELLFGEVIEMSPIGKRHAACVVRVDRVLQKRVPDTVLVSVQNPIQLNDYNEPQPDVTLLRFKPDFYVSDHPQPADVFLVIEVSDSTTAFDKEVKVPLYAAAEIPEVWLVNIGDRHIEVFRSPQEGAYTITETFQAGETVTLGTVAGVTVQVDEILP